MNTVMKTKLGIDIDILSTKRRGAGIAESVEPSHRKVESVNPTVEVTEPLAPKKAPLFNVKRVLMVLGVLIACVWAVKALMPKPQLKEVSHGAN